MIAILSLCVCEESSASRISIPVYISSLFIMLLKASVTVKVFLKLNIRSILAKAISIGINHTLKRSKITNLNKSVNSKIKSFESKMKTKLRFLENF